ncbi:MAG TPA: PSD1 and planctomycete cytochrome C domain-containing protein [Terriglobia bacterium]|nr:PSD1 and planctomycete cytochrome C domain-containing protein [Terriglobia bacterium]
MTHHSRVGRGWTVAMAVFGVIGSCWLAMAIMAQPQTRTSSQPPTKAQLEFFESRIRPIFANNCYRCHSPANGNPRGGLELDWKGGWEKGGSEGPAIVPGDPEKSLVILAVRYTDPDLQMPPNNARLSDEQVNDLVSWVRMGAPDPRTTRPSGNGVTYGGSGKNHWAFKPVAKIVPPVVKNETWVRNDVDRFVLAKLEANGMTANGPADKRTLIRRAYYDLIGLPPTPEQVNAFLADESPNAFEKVIDSLLASPRYGERWARHWLDVARYSDTKGQPNRRREETAFYPYAWTYRDYVIKAFNEDVPYDQFIREQLAADRIGDGQQAKKNPSTLAALGFLTLGDHFNGNLSDIINDRIDVTSKAFLGLTVTCARCHDHKFDPIPTADYYSLYGIFASSIEPDDEPIIGPPNAEYDGYLARRRDLDERMSSMRNQNVSGFLGDYRQYGAHYLYAMALPERERAPYLTKIGANPALLQNWINFTRPRPAFPVFGVWNAMMRPPAQRFAQQAPRVLDNLLDGPRAAELNPIVVKAFDGQSPRNLADVANIYRKLFARTDPEWEAAMTSVIEDSMLRLLPRPQQNQYRQLRNQSDMLELVDPGAPPRAHVLLDGPRPADSPILIRGQAETPGDVVPRRFLEVLSGSSRPRFRDGSGRLELANAIASKTNPLTARVMVNRVWQHHFGEGFVSTPDDLGNQSSPPTHPELLDWLANRFMTDAWSLKKLHKVILLSATWQQSSRNNVQFAEKDPFNRLLWRANVRRLEFEPLRDSILSIGGGLDLAVGGHPVDLSEGLRAQGGRGRGAGVLNGQYRLSTEPRRTIYGYVDRADLSEVLNVFDFPNPNTSIGKRYETTVPQQALFLMNSPLVIEQVRNVVNRDAFQDAESDDARIRLLYELFFQRLPTGAEVSAGTEFIEEFQAEEARVAAPNPAGPRGAAGRGRGAQARGPQQAGRGGRGRGGAGQAPVRLPLTGWQEYAHALLLTNEAAFIH